MSDEKTIEHLIEKINLQFSEEYIMQTPVLQEITNFLRQVQTEIKEKDKQIEHWQSEAISADTIIGQSAKLQCEYRKQLSEKDKIQTEFIKDSLAYADQIADLQESGVKLCRKIVDLQAEIERLKTENLKLMAFVPFDQIEKIQSIAPPDKSDAKGE